MLFPCKRRLRGIFPPGCAQLSSEQKAKVTKTGTSDPEAYQLYLKGRFYWDKRRREDLSKAKDYFQQAVDKDPNYSLAYLGLAEYYSVVADYTPIPYSETSPKAKLNAKRALAIDDELAEAHAVLGVTADTDWAWSEAEHELGRALELDPSNSRNHVLYALHLDAVGRQEQALSHYLRAVELAPLNLNALDNLAGEYWSMKRFDQGLEQSKKNLEIDPTYSRFHYTLANIYSSTGKYDLWLEEAEKGARFGNEPEVLELLEAGKREYAKAGYRGALKAIVALEEEQAKRIYVDPAWHAGQYALLGEKDHAFLWLEKAYAEKSGFLGTNLKCSLFFESLRSDPRYADLLKRMGLSQ